MNLMRRMVAVSLSLLFGLTTAVHAADSTASVQVNYNFVREENRVNLTGSVSVEADIVTLQVLYPNQENSPITSENIASVVAYYEDTVCSGENGNFSFSFCLPDDKEGTYTVKIGLTDYEAAYIDRFYFMPRTASISAIAQLNRAKSEKDVAGVQQWFTDYYKKFSLTIPAYDTLHTDEAGMAELIRLVTYTPEIAEAELETHIAAYSALAQYNTAETAQEANSILHRYVQELFGKEATFYTTYQRYEEQLQERICAAVTETAYHTVEEFNQAVCEKTILLGIRHSTGYGMISDILHDNSAILKIDFTDCNSLDSPEEVYRRLEGESFSSLSEVKEAFDAEVTRCQQNGGSGAGGSSGGGNSGVGIGTISSVSGGGSFAIRSDSDTQKSIFSDLEGFKWCEKSVERLYNKGIIHGKSEKCYAPADAITRVEFVKLLVSVFGLEQGEKPVEFSDVAQTAWYYNYVQAAVATGVAKGYDDGRFGSEDTITREDMAVMAYRALLTKTGRRYAEQSVRYSDSDRISDYAREAVEYLSSNGVIQGYEGSFMPKEDTNRAQAAVVIDRLLQIFESE